MSFLCADADERARLLDMSRRLRPAKLGAVLLLAIAAATSVPVYGWRMQIPLLLAACVFGLVQLRGGHSRHPALPFAVSWLLAQAAILGALSLASGPPVYMLALFVVPTLMAAAVFPGRVVAAGAAITIALILGAGLLLMNAAATALPPVLIVPVTVLLELTLLASRTGAADQAARQSAVADQLTGLLNRAALQARAVEVTLHLSRAAAPPIALIVADLDHFKAVNDHQGHATGDRVLAETARRLGEVAGRAGSLYRYGGEEFVAVLEGDSAADPESMAERMRAAVAEAPLEGLSLTLSLGVACSGSHLSDFPALMGCADRALYRAKAAGRNRVVVGGAEEPISGEGLAVLPDRREAVPPGPHAKAEAGSGGSPEPNGRGRRLLTLAPAEREHMLDIVARVTEIGKIGDPLALVALLSMGPWLGWLPLLPIALSVLIMQAVHLVVLPRVQYVERVALAGALVAQAGAGLYVTLARDPLVALPLLTILIFSGAAAAPAPFALLQSAFAAAVMGAAAFLGNPAGILANPTTLALPLALLGTVALFGYAIGQSTVAHRAAAMVDRLTGTLSRAALQSRVAELSHRAQTQREAVSMLIADLDHFKSVNDEHGHANGDAVLVGVAERLRRGVRAFDSVYRIGGEEFLALLIGVEEREALVIAERLRAVVREHPVQGLPVTVSIGAATCPADAAFSYEPLFRAADAALLRAKAAGRDRVQAGNRLPAETIAA